MTFWKHGVSAVLVAGCASTQPGSAPVTPPPTAVTWAQHDPARPQPPVARAVGAVVIAPPADATVLFDGRSLDAWTDANGGSARWKIENGYVEVVAGAGDIRTKNSFGDAQVHVEFATPVRAEGDGQGRGNSGVVLMGRYEVQILDSYGNVTFADGHGGAVFGQHPPLANASMPPGEWQSFDIIFRSKPARLTVIQNGVVVQESRELAGATSNDERLPLSLQNGGQPVRFRNIWIRELSSE